MADAKYWDGSSWVSVPSIKHWDGAQWADVKRVLQWDGASWDEVWSGASGPESPFYLLDTCSSTELSKWEKGYYNNDYTYYENSNNYIRLQANYDGSASEVAGVYSYQVDLTGYNKLYITHTSTSYHTDSRYYKLYLIISTSKTGDKDTYTARKALDQACTDYTEYLDISSYSGNYWVRVNEYLQYGTDTAAYVKCEFNKVWLEV